MAKFSNGNGKPDFEPGKGSDLERIQKQHEKAIVKAQTLLPEKIVEQRCHACMSPYRDYIEAQLVNGHGYVAIARSIPDGTVDRRSISNHAKEHMAINDAAFRAVLEEEATLEQQNYEEGVRGALTHRGMIEILMRKGFDDVLTDVNTVEPKDLIQLVKLKTEMDEKYAATQVEEYKRQVTIFTDAIRNVVPPAMQAEIVQEIQRLRNREEDLVPYEKALQPPELVEGTVVDDQNT